MSTSAVGEIKAIAIRQGKNGPMKELDSVQATAGGGLEGDNPVRAERGVTFISAAQWATAKAELDADLPWHTRRANVLVDCDSLAPFCGKTITFGGLTVTLGGETEPCGLMDRIHPGLCKALTPDMRAGIFGEVVEGGTFNVGDVIEVKEDA
jgi:MOSC domain-containing protein YiiM